MRKTLLFNQNWYFHKGDIPPVRVISKGHAYTGAKTEHELVGPAAYNYPDQPGVFHTGGEMPRHNWEKVELPHDYTVLNAPCPTENQALGYLKKENAWYRKHFTAQPEWEHKRVTLLFEGVSTECVIYLNGCRLYRNFSAYNSFEVDLTNYLYFEKENVLAVYTTLNDFEGWWYQGGGIYRNVWLNITAPVYINLWGVYAKPALLQQNNWKLYLETDLQNKTYETVKVTVISELLAANKTIVASAKATAVIPPRAGQTVCYGCAVQNPKLWRPEEPNLYTVKTTVFKNGAEIDENTTRIGFRTFVCDPQKGLFINGRHYKINGLCGHQDQGLFGLAVPDNIHRYKVQLMKEMGANGFRTSHYAYPAAFMDALDEQGFIVMDKTRWFLDTPEALSQLEMLIKRDRNRPSVFFWSVGNEEYHHITKVGQKINKSMQAFVKALDSTRPVTTAVSNSPNQSTVYDDNDILGINYNLPLYNEIHQKYPNKALFASESCACGQTRGWYAETSNENGYVTAYDKTVLAGWFITRAETEKHLNSEPYIMGGYQWSAFEHRGESQWPRLCSQSGAIDFYLQKKDSFFQNKINWINKPSVHILPNHWNFKGLNGQPICVAVYTNCKTAELFLNGRSLGKKQAERYRALSWQVAYEPGELLCKAQNGSTTAQTFVKTTGQPETLRLTRMNLDPPTVENVLLFTLECLDKNGCVVENAAETVRFFCNENGRVLATGSDVCDHTPPAYPVRKMRAGKITVAVKVLKELAPLKLYAESEHCGFTVIEVK